MQIGSLTLRATLQPCQNSVSDHPQPFPRFRLSKLEKRQARKVSQEARMTEFLVKNHFFLDDINEPRGPGRHESEQLWPIHGAAELGDSQLLRSLLRARADSTQVQFVAKICLLFAFFFSSSKPWIKMYPLASVRFPEYSHNQDGSFQFSRNTQNRSHEGCQGITPKHRFGSQCGPIFSGDIIWSDSRWYCQRSESSGFTWRGHSFASIRGEMRLAEGC